jgi:glycerophosphoryl diester phosphodiesterase
MKKKKWLLGALLLLLIVYLVFPVLLQLFYQWGYNKNELMNMVIIGHRGGASIGIENTLACYQKGIEAGADMIEIDIHQTKDNHIVICHDQSIDRTTNGKGLIRDMTLSEIRQYRCIDKDGHATNELIPTLDEVFDLFLRTRATGNPCKLLIEIKRTNDIYQGIEERLLKKIASCNAKDWVTVQSFNDFALEKIHQLDPTIRLEKLFFFKLPGLPIIMDWFHFTKFSYEKYNYVSSFNMNYRWLTRNFLNDIHRHGKEVKIWTLEGTDAPHLDVDGIITNRPDLWARR